MHCCLKFTIAFGVVAVASCAVCNVKDYGAVGDGKHNDTKAIQAAIEACAKAAGGTVVLPADGTFLSWPQSVSSVANLTVEVSGLLRAPSDPSQWPGTTPAFLTFSNTPGLVLTGSGVVNGSGAEWWAKRRAQPSDFAPYLLSIRDSARIVVEQLTLAHSPKFHLVLDAVSGPSVVRDITVQAPQDSPNTDGIDPGSGTSGLLIANVSISNGDDCVAIKPGVSNVTVINATCADGHGISIGSIGEDGSTGSVSDIAVLRSRLVNSENGCRIKTWQGGKGLVSGVVYEDVTMQAVDYPLVINQYYCPHSQHPGPCSNSSKAVNVTNVTFRRVTGTHNHDIAASILCSDAVPCTHLKLEDVDLQPIPGKKSEFQVWEAYGSATNVTPPVTLWGP